MKRILLILIFAISIHTSHGQDLRKTDWKFIVSDVVMIGVDTFQINAVPIDFNDKNAISRTVGNYVTDFVDRTFKVIDSTSTTLTVVDLAHENIAPQTNQVARCYRSVLNGSSLFSSIGGVDVSVLDELSRWKGVARNNELFARALDSTITWVDTTFALLPESFDPVAIHFGNTTQQYDIDGETWVSSSDGTPNAAGHLLPACLTAIATAYDGSEFDVRENTGAATETNPLTVQFTWTGITTFNIIKFRIHYDGSTSHTMLFELWNGATWDDYIHFSDIPGFELFTAEVLVPATYVIGGTVLGRFRHESTGSSQHHLEIDYIIIGTGGGGGGGAVQTAIQTPLMPVGSIEATNVQHGIEELDTEKITNADETDQVWESEKSDYWSTTQITNADTTRWGSGEAFKPVHQVSHGLSVEDWVRNNTGSYVTAQGNSAVNADVLGVVSEVISADSFLYQYSGVYTQGTWVDGTNYFLSTTVSGEASVDTDYGDGDVRVYLGVGVSDGLLLEIDVGVLFVFAQINYYEDYLTDNETEIDVGFILNSTTLVFINGGIISSDTWDYTGTTITLDFSPLAQDIIIVSNANDVPNYFEDILTNGENNIDIGFKLTSTTMVYFNGGIILSDLWSGLGTQILNLALDTKLYDNLIIKN